MSERDEKLNAPLDPASVKQRQGGGGRQLSYIEGWRAIKNANEVFGFDGWSTEVTNLTCVESSTQGNPNYQGQNSMGYLVAYTARVQVTVESAVRDMTTSHEDVGYGEGIEYTNVGQAHESAIKEAVTDAEKRALRHWGNQFGLSLYDKDARPAETPSAAAAPPPAAKTDKVVTEPQLKRLWAISQGKGVSAQDISNYVLEQFGYDSVRKLDMGSYDKVVAWVEQHQIQEQDPLPFDDPEQDAIERGMPGAQEVG